MALLAVDVYRREMGAGKASGVWAAMALLLACAATAPPQAPTVPSAPPSASSELPPLPAPPADAPTATPTEDSSPPAPSASSWGGALQHPFLLVPEPRHESVPDAFDRGAAAFAMGSVNFRPCTRDGAVHGEGHLQVTFDPSGRVTNVIVDSGPFVGTPTGACVAALFRRLNVPPFGGAPVRVGRVFTLR